MSKGRIALSLLWLFAASAAVAQDDFNPQGFRSDHYRAPVPAEAPGATSIGVSEVEALRDSGAVLLDVLGQRYFRIDDNGAWSLPESHRSLPGAVWLPVVGWGSLEPWQDAYLRAAMQALTGNDTARPVVVFCKTDCWLSWNTIRRLHQIGYTGLHWFPGGVEAWEAAGQPMAPVLPWPVPPAIRADVPETP